MSIEPNDRIIDLVDSLPTVLAIPLAEYERENNPVLTLWAASDLMEITLKFLVMAALGEHEELPAELQEELRDKQLERPTLGNWMGMAEIIGNYLPSDTRLSEIPSTAARIRELLGTNESSESEGLLSMRNKFLAHGGPCKQKQAQELVEIWKPKVDEVVENSLDWLSNHKLLAIDASGESFLLQGEEAVEWEDKDNLATGSGVGSAWLLLEGTFLPLGPLTTFDTEERALNLYIRREEVGLQYLRMDDEGGFQESGREEVEWFRKRFHSRLKNQSTSEFIIHSFESDIRKEAARRVGRAEELEKLLHSLRSMDRGYLWIGGPAGIGKSNLMCCAMEALLDDPPENILVLPYLFRAGDDRCGKESFLRFVRERLEKSELLVPAETSSEEKEEGSQNKKIPDNPIKELRDLFSRLQEGKKVLLLLDGLDEIAERSPRFVEDIIFGIFSDLDKFLLAGAARPDFGIPESFLSCGALDPFPKGLPSMGENDARAFLLERAGNIRKRMLGMDKEKGEEVTNRFFAKVAERSDGLPIYLNCLLHDLHQGKISPENPDSLPRGIHAYHEELLQRHSLGDFQAVATPSLVILAMAHEPLTTVELTVFLKRMNRIGTENLELINRVLGLLSSMLKRAPDPGGEEGYTLYHHSLREHILNSSNLAETVISIRNSFSNSRLRPSGDALDVYLYRRGVSHLLENNRREDAIEWMTDFELTMGRFQALDFSGRAADSWYADWEKLAKFIKFSRDCEIWWDFARSNRHYFRKSGWETWRVFFQAAMDHANDSPVTIGAEKFYADGKCDWNWLRWLNRPKEFKVTHLSSVLEGHTGLVHGAAELTNGSILSWSEDQTLRVWDRKNGESLLVLEGHKGSIHGAAELTDGSILSWSEDQTLRVWDRENGESLLVLEGHKGSIHGAAELTDGSILSWSEDETLRVWDRESGESNMVLEGHAGAVEEAKELSNGNILSCSEDETFRVWDRIRGKSVALLKDFVPLLSEFIELSKDRILTWCPGIEGDTVRIWSTKSGELISGNKLKIPSKNIYGARELSDGRILFWSNGDLQVWDIKSSEMLSEHKGHISPIIGAKELFDGKILSWSCRKDIRLWNSQSGELISILNFNEEKVSNLITSCPNFYLSWDNECNPTVLNVSEFENFNTIAELDCEAEIRNYAEISDMEILSWHDDGTLRLWNGKNFSGSSFLEGENCDQIHWVKELVDGKILMFSGSEGRLQIRDVITNEPVAFLNTSTSFWSNWRVGVVELANSKILFWNGKDEFLYIWDYRRSNLLPKFQGHYSKVAGALELLDHSILSWHSDTRLVLWDRKSGKCILVMEGHTGAVEEAKELSNGNILSWSEDQTLRVWDRENGESLLVLEGHTGSIHGAAELTDGSILSWSEDETLRIWDRKSGKCILVLEGHAGAVTEAKELSDGNILSLSKDDWSNETLTIWNTHSGTACLVSRGHKSKIIRTGELPDGQIFSWHNDCSTKLYNRFIFGDEKLIENKGPQSWPSIYKDFAKIFKEFQLNLLNLQHKVSSISKNILIADKGRTAFKIFINTKNSYRKFDNNHNIRIARGRKTYGPYDRRTIEEWLASGRLVSNDWAWTRGMKEWASLEKVLENTK